MKMKPYSQSQSEPRKPGGAIAILSAACRLPGGVNNLDDYWELLQSGRDVITEVPPDRFDAAALYDADPDAPGRIASRWGGFLNDIRSFDPSFFGISIREANAMDPQQRLLLEVIWEALESAGLQPSALRGSDTGVVIGTSAADFPLVRAARPETTDSFTSVGQNVAILANRIAHVFDLHGPNLTVDTACAASLTALHLGAASLRRRECRLAIVGGVNMILHPFPYIGLTKARMPSPTGRSRVFDRDADGYVRGEGCGAVVLARLEDAQAMGAPILAILRGSAIGQDGHTNGISAPNGQAQERLYREALMDAGMEPSQVSLIEAHGTGTKIGDITELRSLRAVYGSGEQPCLLGSVKATIGHLEGAAGMAGLLKTLLCLRHQRAPRQVNFQQLPDESGIESSRIRIPTEITPWNTDGAPRFAAISAFGFGGALAHALIEQAPPTTHLNREFSGGPLLFSAHSPDALRSRAAALRTWLSSTSASPADIAWTSSVARDTLRFRGGVVGSDAKTWAEALEVWLAEPPVRTISELGQSVAFVYAGQGPQWWAMGRELLQTDPVFRSTIERCDTIFRSLGGDSILDALQASEAESRLSETWFAQPALLALEVALTERLRAWGIEPSAIVGHSLGEIAACWAAGALTLEQAMTVVHHRVRMQRQTDAGRMASAQLSFADADSLVAPYGEQLVVAAYNSPTEVALSGQEAALEQALADLEARGIGYKRMRVRYAFHSPQMEESSQVLAAELRDLRAAAPRLPIFSSVRGGPAEPGDFGGDYHARNVREPVRFAQAISAMIEKGIRIFIEISPHPTLRGYIETALEAQKVQGLVVSTLRRKQPELPALHQTFVTLWSTGLMLDPARVLPEAELTDVPPVTMQRREHWFTTETAAAPQGERMSPHPCIRMPVQVFNPDGTVRLAWTIQVDASGYFQLQDHLVRGRIVLPGAGIVDIALAAARHGLGKPYIVENLELLQPVSLAAGGTQRLQLAASYQPGSSADDPHAVLRFELAASEGTSWRIHARGRLRPSTGQTASTVDASAIFARCSNPVDEARHVARLEAVGFGYGPAFRPLADISMGTSEVVAKLVASPEVRSESVTCEVHPGLLDGAFQLAALANQGIHSSTWLPVGIDAVEKHGPCTGELYAWTKEVSSLREDERAADIVIFGPAGDVRLAVTKLRVRRVSAARNDYMDSLLSINWEELPTAIERAPSTLGRWALYVGKDAERLASVTLLLQAALSRRGAEVSVVATPADLPHELQGVIYLPALVESDADADIEQEGILLPALELCRTLSLLVQPPALWLLTHRCQSVGLNLELGIDPRGAGLWGLCRAIRVEMPTLRATAADLDRINAEAFAALVERLDADVNGSGDDQLVFRDERVLSARLSVLPPPSPPLAPAAGRPYRLHIDRSRQLDRLHLRAIEYPPLGPDEVEVDVEAAGLNFLDVVMALGMIPELLNDSEEGPDLGVELAGRVRAVGANVTTLRVGDRVMGPVVRCFGSRTRTKTSLLVKIPETLTFAEAATIPVVFLTAWLGLVHRARLRPGERVLIHAGTGGVGMAAIQIAQHLGAEVYATAGSEAKRALLVSLGVRHVFDSRSLSFVDGILTQTNGEGVDVVLNSLAEPLLSASVSVLRNDGRFVEVGKRDYFANAQFGLRPFLKRLSFSLVDLNSVRTDRLELTHQLFAEMLPLFSAKKLRPLPSRIMPLSEATAAFSAMARGEHTGKIVLVPDENPLILPAVGVAADSSVLITGGLGGLGLQVARWLAAHGSPRLWLLGRRAPDATQERAIAVLRQLGARIEVIQGDVADAQSLDGVLAKVRAAGPPLRGVVHTAGVVLDRTIGDLDAETTRAQLRPKVQGAWNLHRACAGDRLDFFVLFSSLAGFMGSAGQSAYAASNALLDGLAELRRSKGLPALSIAWGAWGEVGMAASPALLERMMTDGVQPIEPGRGAQTFGQLLQASPPVVGVAPMSWERWAAQNRVRARTPFFQPLVPTEDVQGGEAGRSVQASLSALAPAEREGWIIERLREQVAAVLRIPASRVDPALAMSVLGFDSLMTVELRSRIETTFEASVPLATLIRAESLTAVAAMVLSSLTPRLAAGATSSAAPVAQVSPTTQAAPAIQAAPVAPTAPTASARSVVSVHAPVAVPTSVVRSVTTVAKASAPERASLPSLLIHFDPEHAFEPFPQTDMQQAYEIGEQDGFPLGGVSYLYYREFEKEQPDLDHLERTWNQIVQRHSMLRCVFLDDGTARILPDVPFYRFEVYDLSGFAEGSPEQHAAALELRARLSSLRVNTKRWPLFQIFAIRLGGNRVRLCLAVAMTVCDAMSLRTAAYEWCQLILGRGSLKPLTLSFRDYQLAVKRMEQTEAFERARRFWMDKLDRIPPAPALPLTKPLFEIQASARRVCHAMRIESSIWNRLRANAVAAGVTPSVALCTAFSDVLAAWSESRHFTLNLPSFNRPPVHPEVGRLVGELVSTMLLEVRHDGATFTERAQAIHLQLLENLEHQLFPGVRVLGEMSRRGGIVLMPVVFSSTVGHRPPPDETEVAEAGMGKTVYTATTTPQVLFDHILTEEAGDLVLTWDVIEEAFPPGLIASMFDAYRELLYRLADGTEAWTSPRRRLLPAAQRSVRAAVNATDAPIAPSLLHELVFDCAARHPERLAIVSGPQLLSYGELALRSTALALALRDRGLRVGSPVAILIPKGWQQVVATLGILLAGGVVAPIDTEAPPPRVLQILELSGAGHLLISGESNLHRDGLAVLDVDTLALAEPRSSTSSFPRCQQTDPAYLIFTSGSTGTPKGVLLGHRGFVNMVHETVARLAITDRDCALGLTSLHHDLSIFDIFGLLSVGGKLVLPDADRYRDPAHWTELIARHGVTFWNSVPALLEMLLLHFERRSAVFPDGGEPGAGVAELHSLRLVSLGGDWIALSQPARLLALVPRVQMISIGGPTETSVWNIWHRIEKLDPSWPSIPYGRPTANARYYVLDDQLEDRPDWVGGTMWCAGAGLALGYFQDETRTCEAFRIHPDTGERIYNTGDRGRYHPDGTLEFLGRADLQVKIRGVRIELAECDAALSSHPFVRQAVIVAQGSPQTGERWLAAFVSPTEAALATTHEASAFKMQRYGQRRFQAESAGIELPSHPQSPLTRVSQRTFTSELVPLSQLADLLAVLQAVNEPGQASSRHRYPSGGGLYPLETYVYAHRVDGLEHGTYYYDAFAHRLVQITPGATLDTSWHVPHNRSIVVESAFSIFLVGDMDAIEPLYGPFARDMCLLEAGYMGQLLATEAGRLGVGLCPIGGMDTVPLGPLLRLTARQLVLHSFEGGIPDNTRSAPGPQQAFINDLRAHMEARLPAAMVPTRFHVLRDLPLSANGKIDRKQLTAQVIASGPPAGDATANKAPESETERFIIEHLCRELDIPSLDAEANFFHAGASSIHLAALATVLSNRVGRTISIMALFERPTARKLGEWLTGSSNMEEDPVARARVRGTRRRERRDVRGE